MADLKEDFLHAMAEADAHATFSFRGRTYSSMEADKLAKYIDLYSRAKRLHDRCQLDEVELSQPYTALWEELTATEEVVIDALYQRNRAMES